MPRLQGASDEMIQGAAGHFTFSGIRPDRLSATEYTLATLEMDVTGSVGGFEKELIGCVKSALDSLKKSPRAQNLLVRFVTFNENIREEHGFMPLQSIDLAKYKDPVCAGTTALYDALYSGIASANQYAKTLVDHHYNVNAITLCVTDGADNASKMSRKAIKEELKRAVSAEEIESHVCYLIGINASHNKSYLEKLHMEAELNGYIDAGNADAANLAKLAGFISKSISSQSSSLGSGGPSQPLTI